MLLLIINSQNNFLVKKKLHFISIYILRIYLKILFYKNKIIFINNLNIIYTRKLL